MYCTGLDYYLKEMDWLRKDYMVRVNGFVNRSFRLPGLESIREHSAYYELQIYFISDLEMDPR